MDHILPAGSSPHSETTLGEDLDGTIGWTFLHHKIRFLQRLLLEVTLEDAFPGTLNSLAAPPFIGPPCYT